MTKAPQNGIEIHLTSEINRIREQKKSHPILTKNHDHIHQWIKNTFNITFIYLTQKI